MDKLAKTYIQDQSIYVFTSDDLNNLPPRNLFKDRLIQSMAFARRYGYKVGVIAIDLNSFDEDSNASSMNDSLLRTLGEQIIKILRETDTISSQGVDEFLIILPDVPEDGNEMIVAKKIYNLLVQPIRLNNKIIRLKPFIGVTRYPDDGETPDQIMIQANIAMVEARTRNVPILHLQRVESLR
jgi:diguanylate cyclase (GGDEF)-like protein